MSSSRPKLTKEEENLLILIRGISERPTRWLDMPESIIRAGERRELTEAIQKFKELSKDDDDKRRFFAEALYSNAMIILNHIKLHGTKESKNFNLNGGNAAAADMLFKAALDLCPKLKEGDNLKAVMFINYAQFIEKAKMGKKRDRTNKIISLYYKAIKETDEHPTTKLGEVQPQEGDPPRKKSKKASEEKDDINPTPGTTPLSKIREYARVELNVLLASSEPFILKELASANINSANSIYENYRKFDEIRPRISSAAHMLKTMNRKRERLWKNFRDNGYQLPPKKELPHCFIGIPANELSSNEMGIIIKHAVEAWLKKDYETAITLIFGLKNQNAKDLKKSPWPKLNKIFTFLLDIAREGNIPNDKLEDNIKKFIDYMRELEKAFPITDKKVKAGIFNILNNFVDFPGRYREAIISHIIDKGLSKEVYESGDSLLRDWIRTPTAHWPFIRHRDLTDETSSYQRILTDIGSQKKQETKDETPKKEEEKEPQKETKNEEKSEPEKKAENSTDLDSTVQKHKTTEKPEGFATAKTFLLDDNLAKIKSGLKADWKMDDEVKKEASRVGTTSTPTFISVTQSSTSNNFRIHPDKIAVPKDSSNNDTFVAALQCFAAVHKDVRPIIKAPDELRDKWVEAWKAVYKDGNLNFNPIQKVENTVDPKSRPSV